MEAGRAPRRSPTAWLAVLLASVALVGAACSPAPTVQPSADVANPSATLDPQSSPTPTSTTAPTSTASAAPNTRPLAGSGAIAIARSDGTLWMVDTHGQPTRLADGSDGIYGFPAWSPDGQRVAAIRGLTAETSIVVIDTGRGTSGTPGTPVEIFRKTGVGPFYLSWQPDGSAVSFLADEGGGLSLRLAPADGSSPDGDGPGAVIKTGNPFYFAWVAPDRLLAHIGSGPEAYLGEIGLDGKEVGRRFPSSSTFRSPDMSADGKYVGYVRAGTSGTDQVVVATRDGSSEHSMPVVGLTAVDFSPVTDTLAAIGSVVPGESLGVPAGPLRVIEAASGEVRTLLDGTVLSFDWSPDGTTIAAIQFIQVQGTSTSSTAAAPSASPSGTFEVHLAFVDVATGRIRSNPKVQPASRFTNVVLDYFDQYALSHRLWSPDSASFLLPEVDSTGTTTVDVFFPDGGAPTALEGDVGFWNP